MYIFNFFNVVIEYMIITNEQYKNYRHIIVSRKNYDELKKMGQHERQFQWRNYQVAFINQEKR
jgi:hypothetical protein